MFYSIQLLHFFPILFLLIALSDVWGDAVNTASRMESHGIPGAVHLTADVYQKVKDMGCFKFKCLGVSIIKSMGTMITYAATPNCQPLVPELTSSTDNGTMLRRQASVKCLLTFSRSDLSGYCELVN
jgi:hypothetical protein